METKDHIEWRIFSILSGRRKPLVLLRDCLKGLVAQLYAKLTKQRVRICGIRKKMIQIKFMLEDFSVP